MCPTLPTAPDARASASVTMRLHGHPQAAGAQGPQSQSSPSLGRICSDRSPEVPRAKSQPVLCSPSGAPQRGGCVYPRKGSSPKHTQALCEPAGPCPGAHGAEEKVAQGQHRLFSTLVPTHCHHAAAGGLLSKPCVCGCDAQTQWRVAFQVHRTSPGSWLGVGVSVSGRWSSLDPVTD